MKLLHQIDCTSEYSNEQYFSFYPSRVVKADCGTYREAAPKRFSRFGYRFEIKNLNAPHMAVIRYPDDKRRFMMINDGTSYDLSSAIITGQAFPLSGTIKELRQVFWSRFHDMSICLMSWDGSEPAAAFSIEIYEMTDEELAPAEIPPVSNSGRKLGIMYEDPCGTGASEGAGTFNTWLDHLIKHAKHTGQNLLQYPICWYHGPWFPGTSERAEAFSTIVAPDRKQYVAWTDDPPNWPAQLLKRFEKEELEFMGSFTLLRLSSLMKRMNIDIDAIKRGTPTINNMLWNNEVQSGTMDWTAVYNTLNYPAMMQRNDPLTPGNDFNWAYGEKVGYTQQAGPIFNPLHPEVQEAIIRFFSETCKTYAKFKSFKGISVNMWAPTLLWFGSLRSGYDDYTINEFEKDTGIKVMVESTDPERFSRRYEFLTYYCRPAWLEWRCRRIHDFIVTIRDAMTKIRADLRLTLVLWSEPYVPAVRGNGEAQHQLCARSSLLEIYQEAGLDLNLYIDEKKLDFDLQLDAGGRDRSISFGNAPGFMFRDQDYLDESVWNILKKQSQSGVLMFHCWHEAWGNHKWFTPDPNDPNLPDIAEVYGCHGNAIRINSHYPIDGFWWDSQLRIAPAFPPSPHYLEHYAHAVAKMDTIKILAGGLFLDKTHNSEIRRFAQVFRALPAKRFQTLGDSIDPVAVRTLIYQGKLYCYLVNQEYYPITVTLDFVVSPHKWTDLSGRNTSPHAIILEAYELRAFIMDQATELTGFDTIIPEKVQTELQKLYRQAQSAFAAISTDHRMPVGTKKIMIDLESAMMKKNWSRLRHLLGSYPINKCLELANGT